MKSEEYVNVQQGVQQVYTVEDIPRMLELLDQIYGICSMSPTMILKSRQWMVDVQKFVEGHKQYERVQGQQPVA